jgi:hypothetical protein
VDWLKAFLLVVGSIFLTTGAIVAWRDAFNDYHTGVWGILGGCVAAAGAAMLYIRRIV